MKKELLILCAAVALVGCDQTDRGGVGTDTTTDTTIDTTTPSEGSLTNTNRMDQQQQQLPQQGTSPQQGTPPQQAPPQQPTPQ